MQSEKIFPKITKINAILSEWFVDIDKCTYYALLFASNQQDAAPY